MCRPLALRHVAHARHPAGYHYLHILTYSQAAIPRILRSERHFSTRACPSPSVGAADPHRSGLKGIVNLLLSLISPGPSPAPRPWNSAADARRTTLKLLDFGISKLSDAADPGARPGAEGALTQATTMLGSPRYMSPEQLLSSRDVNASTDIWAQQPRSMREHVPSIPPKVDEVVLRWLAWPRTPADRPRWRSRHGASRKTG